VEAKQRYQDRVDAYRTAREDFLSVRKRISERRTVDDASIRLERARTFLLRATEAMEGHLKVMKIRIEATEALPEDVKQSFLNDIESHISWYEDKEDAIREAKNKDDLLEIAKEIREKWLESREDLKRVVGAILNSQLERIIDKGNAVSERIDSKTQELKEGGADTEALEALLESFQAKLEFASELNEEAAEKFDHGDFEQGHELIRKAHTEVRGAFSILKDIVREMRTLLSEEIR
jgi:hypothetical protein